MKLKQISKLFPDLRKYYVSVVHQEKRYFVEDLKGKPQLLDRDIKKIYLSRGSIFSDSVGMEIHI